MILSKKFNHVYISGIGVYVPPFRIKVAEIAKAWQQEGDKVSQSLGLTQKAVADYDEDSATMAVAASLNALNFFNLDKKDIGAVFVGSESHAYAVKPTSTIVGEWLGLNPEYFSADLQFACKAATAGIQIAAAMIEAGMIKTGLVIGTDKAQAKPGDALEYTAASGAVAILLSRNEGIARLKSTYSYSTDTPDFWRRQTQRYPRHAGRFTGEPAYFHHLKQAVSGLLNQSGKKISDFDRVVFHMPNAKFPVKLAKSLSIEPNQFQDGLTVKYIGNPYSASSLIGLTKVLADGRNDQEILLAAYGSGAGADSLWISQLRPGNSEFIQSVNTQLENQINIGYVDYLKKMEILT